MKRRPSFKNLPKIQAKRFKKLRLEKERARAGRTRNRPIKRPTGNAWTGRRIVAS